MKKLMLILTLTAAMAASANEDHKAVITKQNVMDSIKDMTPEVFAGIILPASVTDW